MSTTENDQNSGQENSGEYEIPEYTYPSNEAKYHQICKELGVYDQDKLIFDNLLEYINDHAYPINFHDFCVFLQNKSLPGLTLSVNVETYARRVVNRIISYKYGKMITGNSDNPGTFVLSTPYDLQAEQFKKETELKSSDNPFLEQIKSMLNSHYQNIADTQKIDIPFPTRTFILQKFEKELEEKAKLPEIWKNHLIRIKCDEFTSKFIKQSTQSFRLIQIDFDEENHILLTPESERGLFQNVLAQKILQYVNENPGIQDHILKVLKQNQKTQPDIHQIFKDIGDESSFFWILTFKKIMEALHQQKREQTIYLHFYEAACLLYQYSLFQREVNQQDQKVRQAVNTFKQDIIRMMIENYSEPWTIDSIQAWHNNLPHALLQEKLTSVELDGMITSINENATQNSHIPPILTIRTPESTYFIHKYRFCQIFLMQLQKETINLKNHYIKEWSERPVKFPDDSLFDQDIDLHMSSFFRAFLYKTIPDVFSHKSPAEGLFPDIVIIKEMKLQDYDISDPQKQKVIYEAMTMALFTKKFSLDVKPLHSLFELNQKELHKMAREYALRNIPFYKRGLIGTFFGWFFMFLEKIAKHDEIRLLADKATTGNECDALITKYKPTKYAGYARQQAERRKKELNVQQKRGTPSSEKENPNPKESAEKKRERVEALKKYFLAGESAKDRLLELEKEWNQKIGKAQAETTNNVNNAIISMMRKIKHFKVTKEEIETLADRVSKDPAFLEIKNKGALKNYIAIFVLQKLLQRID